MLRDRGRQMKEIRFSDYAQLKMEVLASHEVIIDPDFVIETVRAPDRLETKEEGKLIAQKRLGENLSTPSRLSRIQRFYFDHHTLSWQES